MDQPPPEAAPEADGGTTTPVDQPGSITDAERQTVRALYRRARDYADDELSPKLRKAWRAYDGKVDIEPAYFVGKDESGRKVYHGSQAVVREVFDKIRATLPEMARIFLSSDEMVAFDPVGPEDEEQAKQATDYINYVIMRGNNGEELLLDAFIDWAMKFAAAKVYWSVEEKQEEAGFSGLSQQALNMLLMRAAMPQGQPVPPAMAEAMQKAGLGSDIEIVGVEAEPEEQTAETQFPQPDGSVLIVPHVETVFRGKVRKNVRKGRHAIELIPQDELILDPDAQSEAEAAFLGHDCYRRVTDVVAQGIPYDVVAEHATGSIQSGHSDAAAQARRNRTANRTAASDVPDESLKYVRVCEALVRLDRDGDGVAERYKALMLGEAQELISLDPGDDCYYVLASPIRRPHEPIGDGVAEILTDVQDQLTALMRGWINNMNRANNPREVVSSSDTDAYEDMISPFGGPIRAQNPQGIGFHVVPFTAGESMPLIQYVENRSAGRTGISMAGQGLDPDVLKGQTVDAAKAVVTAPQVQLEFLAREFAAGFVRPINLALLRLSKAYQDKATTVRLRGKWVEVDPSQWSADMDCSVRVGLGGGTKQEKLAGLAAIMTKQEMLMQIGSPLVSTDEYRNALGQFTELMGYKATQRFFKEPTPEEQQAAAASAEQQKQQAAAQAIQLEAAKAGAVAQEKAKGDVEKAKVDAARAHQQAQLDAELAREKAVLDMTIQREKMAQELTMFREAEATKFRLRMAELEMERELEKTKIQAKSRDGQGNLPSVVQ